MEFIAVVARNRAAALALPALFLAALSSAARAQPAAEAEPDPAAGEAPTVEAAAGPEAPVPDESSPAAAAPDSVAESAEASPQPQVEAWGIDEEDVEDDGGIFDTRLYGYVDAYFEKVANTPAGVDGDGQTVFESNPYEFDVLNLNVMVQGSIMGRYRYFLNLAAPGAGGLEDLGIAVRNAWVELPIFGNYLALRAGKTYRRFGLYNEILDAVPTFIGVEPPELFDKDHLMLTRTTNLMLHGNVILGSGNLQYSLTTGNDERAAGAVPVGGDVRYRWRDLITVGTSFYSTMGDALPGRHVGDGSPRGGVIDWMAKDQYAVFGGYVELTLSDFLLQGAYWQAEHQAVRDDPSVLLLADGNLNQRQRERFFVGGDPDNGVRNDNADYSVQTGYLRTGYAFNAGDAGEFTPYGQVDFYRNPETIASKALGGDNEAGLSDDGQFVKATLGLIYRPIAPIALKVDGSTHVQKFNGETVTYPEIRTSLSYLWDLGLGQ